MLLLARRAAKAVTAFERRACSEICLPVRLCPRWASLPAHCITLLSGNHATCPLGGSIIPKASRFNSVTVPRIQCDFPAELMELYANGTWPSVPTAQKHIKTPGYSLTMAACMSPMGAERVG